MISDPNPLARKLGYASMLPFAGGTLFIWLLVNRVDADLVSFVAQAIAAFAALALSALGGMLWGLIMPHSHYNTEPDLQQKHALWTGAAYVLGAWIAVLMPPHAGLVVLGILLIASYLTDRKRYHELRAEGWLTMRFRLTIVCSLCCFLSAAQI